MCTCVCVYLSAWGPVWVLNHQSEVPKFWQPLKGCLRVKVRVGIRLGIALYQWMSSRRSMSSRHTNVCVCVCAWDCISHSEVKKVINVKSMKHYIHCYRCIYYIGIHGCNIRNVRHLFCDAFKDRRVSGLFQFPSRKIPSRVNFQFDDWILPAKKKKKSPFCYKIRFRNTLFL